MARAATVLRTSTPERVSVLETKVDNIEEKIDGIKDDIKEMHDCLDRTGETIDKKLCEMQAEYRQNSSKFFDHANSLHEEDQNAHKELAKKIADLEAFKNKWATRAMIAMSFLAGAGWLGHVDIQTILKIFAH